MAERERTAAMEHRRYAVRDCRLVATADRLRAPLLALLTLPLPASPCSEIRPVDDLQASTHIVGPRDESAHRVARPRRVRRQEEPGGRYDRAATGLHVRGDAAFSHVHEHAPAGSATTAPTTRPLCHQTSTSSTLPAPV